MPEGNVREELGRQLKVDFFCLINVGVSVTKIAKRNCVRTNSHIDGKVDFVIICLIYEALPHGRMWTQTKDSLLGRNFVQKLITSDLIRRKHFNCLAILQRILCVIVTRAQFTQVPIA